MTSLPHYLATAQPGPYSLQALLLGKEKARPLHAMDNPFLGPMLQTVRLRNICLQLWKKVLPWWETQISTEEKLQPFDLLPLYNAGPASFVP